VIGELDGQEWVAEVWCKLGGVMVDVLYRHAPETKWPGPVEDAVDGWRFVSQGPLPIMNDREEGWAGGREEADEHRCSITWQSWG